MTSVPRTKPRAKRGRKLAPVIPIDSTRYQLVQDNDGHWYLVDAGRMNEWEEWLDSGLDALLKGLCYAVDGPHQVTFSLPTVDGKAVRL